MRAAVAACGARKRGPDDAAAGRTSFTQFFSDIQALREPNAMALDQYKCLLAGIIEKVRRGTLDPAGYPFVGRRVDGMRVRRLVVFFVGGATYAEMRVAAEAADLDVVVGGTTVHNAASFIANEVMPFAKVSM
jgi:hypothetical protein